VLSVDVVKPESAGRLGRRLAVGASNVSFDAAVREETRLGRPAERNLDLDAGWFQPRVTVAIASKIGRNGAAPIYLSTRC
jgi:hypothetical protein